jgi:hypothetical protein
MQRFETAVAAQEYVSERVDVPVPDHYDSLRKDMFVQSYTLPLAGERFSNVYELAYRANTARPNIHVPARLNSVFAYAQARGYSNIATCSGGFFFLTDRYSALPRQCALNLAIEDGMVCSLPVADREAIVSDRKRLHAKSLEALGTLSINGYEL